MTSVTKPLPRRTTKITNQLKAALTKALQGHPECHGFKVTAVKLLETNQGLANWDAEFEAATGTMVSPCCKRALLGVKLGVQKRFDLAGADGARA
jgi:hypothetical protein